MDTLGVILEAGVSAANLGDRQGLYLLFSLVKGRLKRTLKKVWGDMGYAGEETEAVAKSMGIDFEAVSRNGKRFEVTRKR